MAVGSATRRGLEGLANVLRIVGMLIVLVLVLHIVLTLLDANPANGLATWIRDASDTLNLGLSNLFLPADPKLGIVLNYGTAALVWFVITTVVVRLVRRVS